jgi:hypothetical protein
MMKQPTRFFAARSSVVMCCTVIIRTTKSPSVLYLSGAISAVFTVWSLVLAASGMGCCWGDVSSHWSRQFGCRTPCWSKQHSSLHYFLRSSFFSAQLQPLQLQRLGALSPLLFSGHSLWPSPHQRYIGRCAGSGPRCGANTGSCNNACPKHRLLMTLERHVIWESTVTLAVSKNHYV